MQYQNSKIEIRSQCINKLKHQFILIINNIYLIQELLFYFQCIYS